MSNFRQYGFWWAGLGVLILGKLKHVVNGYSTPRAFSSNEIDRSIEHVQRQTAEWSRALTQHGAGPRPFEGCRVLELGPGPDLGIGINLLAQGARSYAALDVFDLASGVHTAYYERLFTTLGLAPARADHLRAATEAVQRRQPMEDLQYVVRDDFDLKTAFGQQRFDRFVSNAAFEHFDDIEQTISDLSALAADDAMAVFGIDFKTHGRWLIDSHVDPLNIYRFSNWLYRLVTFRGSPNRRSLTAYRRALEANGWKDIRLHDVYAVEATEFARLKPHLARPFRSDDFRYLWVVITARRPRTPRNDPIS